jgi:peroxiredoxin Q/BCP
MRKLKLIIFTILIAAGFSVNAQVLEVNTMAPDFTLTADDGSTLKLSDYRGKNVVLYFYPKDMSTSCRLQAIYFKDNLPKFTENNTVVLGVSTDNVASHQTFKTTENLNFPLLADVDGNISRTYGVLNPETSRANRVTYVINPDGRIVKVYENVDVNTNYSEILTYLGSPMTETRLEDTQRFDRTTTTTTTTYTRTQVQRVSPMWVNRAPYFAVTPYGGAIFPIDRGLRDVFKPGWSAGVDLLYRINREVGIWAGASYNQMTRQTAADVGHYFEGSIGPRYFFTHPKLKAQLFVDAGVGFYNLNQDENLEETEANQYTIEQIDGSKVGINGGVGVTLFVSNAMNVLGKLRYNTIFGTNENVAFLNGGLGLEFRFR